MKEPNVEKSGSTAKI